jgi:3-methyladenine DNA glycosylase AlkD
MSYEEVVAQLEEMGTEQNRKIYSRHGANGLMFGVSFGDLRKLEKKIKRDHELAVQLWDTGIMDAHTLATMIADPKQIDRATAEAWAGDVNYYHLVDVLCGNVLGHTPFLRELAEQWIESDDEWLGRFGWNLVGELADRDKTLEDDYFKALLDRIESEIHTAKKPNTRGDEHHSDPYRGPQRQPAGQSHGNRQTDRAGGGGPWRHLLQDPLRAGLHCEDDEATGRAGA